MNDEEYRTDRFMNELKTLLIVQSIAKAEKGLDLSIRQAHQCWAEHSSDYCAGWLQFRDEDPRNEVLQALTAYRHRHKL